DERLLRRAARDGDGLAELRRGLHVVDAAADQAGLGQDGAVLAPVPAVADADGLAVAELQRARGRSRDHVAHGRSVLEIQVSGGGTGGGAPGCARSVAPGPGADPDALAPSSPG